MRQINADQRHREVCVLKCEKVEKRKYPAGMWFADQGSMHNALKSMDAGLIFTKRVRGFRTLEEGSPMKKVDGEDLWQIAYTSKLTVRGSGSNVSKEMNNIMLHAQKSNARLNISGALLYSPSSKHVFQVLEGPRTTVCSLYEAIQSDGRHKSVKCLHSGQAEERAYSSFGRYHIKSSQPEDFHHAYRYEGHC